MTDSEQDWKKWLLYVVAGALIMTFYVMTRPLNHAESYDCINYALFAENFSLGTAPDSRNILFHAVNRILFLTSTWAGFSFRALDVIALFTIATGSISLVLFARLMQTAFGVATFTSWFGAVFLGVTYGFWRYTGEAEVYIPSIFLILCVLSVLFQQLDDAGVDDTPPRNKKLILLLTSLLAGVAVLYYQVNLIPLFFVTIVLFGWSHFVSYISYSAIGAAVVLSGIFWSCANINGHVPNVEEFVGYLTARNGEFPEPPGLLISCIKSVLAFGHDVFSAHWTRTLEPVRETLDPHIPGCIYNFRVVNSAGVGIQALTGIAAILFVPLLILLARLHWIASAKWTIGKPRKSTLFLMSWLLWMLLVVGGLAPGSFEAWIPMLVPFAALLTVFVFEPCYQLGKQKTLLAFLVLFFCYNFFGGMLLWRNSEGNLFRQETAWIRQELTEQDTVLLNEFDFRVIDYLGYYSNVRVAHLEADDRVVTYRSTPDIRTEPLDDFLKRYQQGEGRLFVMEDVLSPDPKFKECNSGVEKFKAATKLAGLLKDYAELANSDPYGKTYQVFRSKRPSDGSLERQAIQGLSGSE